MKKSFVKKVSCKTYQGKFNCKLINQNRKWKNMQLKIGHAETNLTEKKMKWITDSLKNYQTQTNLIHYLDEPSLSQLCTAKPYF